MFPLTPDDSVQAAKLYASCFSKPWSEEEVRRLTELSGFFGFICTEGMIMLNRVLDEAEIYTVCVRPESRRQGIGRKLLTAAITFARQNGVSRIFLEVAVDNQAALKLYEDFGFVKTGIRKKYYNHTTDALLLSLTLPVSPKA